MNAEATGSLTEERPAGAEDPRIAQVMEEYLNALEAGERPQVAAYLARYPDLGTALARALEGLEFIRTAASQMHESAARVAPAGADAGAPDSLEGRPLGDFRIIRELGRGGMGVVYEAEQLSLGRRVALKVLPFAGTMDARHLQRFRLEAHAAAQLHHSHIVPVYFVGSERGVHFYAMQLIEGQSLANEIANLRAARGQPAALRPDVTVDKDSGPPAPAHAATTVPVAALATVGSTRDSAFFRTAAQLGIQAAEALDHAHQHGIIHRDIKPANLLVDAEGRLWVTDFGLAQVRGDTRLTMTGDLVGTLRYMSPEQALAQRAVIDHRADIYSLGATLYELLTLEPVFDGADRQELLRQIAFEEPRPLRQVNRALPVELETIVLKALEKNSSDRYATAQQLADDLERFLKDEPIRARRPTVVQRARKWARRHAGVAVTASVALGLLLILTSLGLAVNNLLIRGEQKRTQNANERLQDNLELSLKTLDEIYLQVLEDRMPRETAAAPENQDLLTRALGFYERFAERNAGDPKVWREVAKAYSRAGVLQMRLGHYEPAIVALDRAAEVVARLTGDSPGEPEVQFAQAEIYLLKGRTYLLQRELVNEGSHQARVAQAEFQKGIDLLDPLIGNAALSPKYRDLLGILHNDLGLSFHHNEDLVRGEQHYRQAIKVRAHLAEEVADLATRLFYLQQLSLSHGNLAIILNATDRLDEAETEGRETLEILNRVHTQAAALPRFKRGRIPGFADARPIASDLAHAHYHLGNTMRGKRKSRAAEEEYRQAVEFLSTAVKDWPGEMLFRSFLAMFRRTYGLILFEGGKRAEALQQYQQSIDLYRKLQEESGRDLANAAELIDSLTYMGDLLLAEGQRKQAAVHYQQALDLAKERWRRYPNNAGESNNLAWFLAICADPRFRDPEQAVALAQQAVNASPADGNFRSTLGVAQYRRGQWREAIVSLNEARRLGGQAGIEVPLFLAMAHGRLGEIERARTYYQQAVERLRKHEYPPEEPSRWRAEAAGVLGITEQKK